MIYHFFWQFAVFRKELPHVVFKNLQNVYGDLFSVKLGTSWVVILSNIDIVKEALLRKQDQFSGRISAYTGEVMFWEESAIVGRTVLFNYNNYYFLNNPDETSTSQNRLLTSKMVGDISASTTCRRQLL